MQKDQSTARHHAIAIILALAFAAPTAQAGYTVMDDDLFPDKMVPVKTILPASIAAGATVSSPHEQHYILFRKKIWGMSDDNRQTVTDLLPKMKNRQITLIGCLDGKIPTYLAEKRVKNIKEFLISKGIPATQIKTHTASYEASTADHYSVEIYLGDLTPGSNFNDNQALPVKPSFQQPTTTAAITSSAHIPGTTKPAETATTTQVNALNGTVAALQTRLDTIRLIAEKAITEKIDLKSSVIMILEIFNVTPKSSQPTAQEKPRDDFGLVAAPETMRPKEWTLTVEKTLKDNFTAWAKTEGYSVDWRASNYYKVARSNVLTGEMLDSMDRVTGAVNLRMEVWKKDKLIRITDPK